MMRPHLRLQTLYHTVRLPSEKQIRFKFGDFICDTGFVLNYIILSPERYSEVWRIRLKARPPTATRLIHWRTSRYH